MMLLDRIIYLLKSLKLKLAMQVFSIVLYHILILVYFPSLVKTESKMMTASLVVFYLFKIVYWLISAVQIRVGYVQLSSSRILMSSYSFYSSLIFSMYYTLPFVYEIRTILDWVFANTSMFYKRWLKVEDIHAELFMNQCDRTVERNRNHVYGQPRGYMERFTGGCVTLIIMLAILWFPLLLMSSAAPNFAQPLPKNLEMSIGFLGVGEIYKQQQSQFSNMSDEDWDYFHRHHKNAQSSNEVLYTTMVSPNAMTYWMITKDKRNELKDGLKGGGVMSIYYQINMRREGTSAEDSFMMYETKDLNATEKKYFLEILDQKEVEWTFDLVPQFLKMPTLSQKAVLQKGDDFVMQLRPKLKQDDVDERSQYWQFINCSALEGVMVCDETEKTKLYIASPKVPNSGLISSLSSLGIIGLYSVVVLFLYSLLKSNYSGMAHIIMFKDLPDCLGLLQLCDDIIIARQDGDLRLEEDLVNELLLIYRKPALLFERTVKK
ncbi:hypothetical protein EIN_328330 [Entamoeba invadens IP1]|uniref:Uncharacterized protein n=1 Tax=Entamoeba invadens IP1 TaxID=370355 RepID=A0A0A1U3K3_ENTIV|nr:hypothetical protein EIN_328330 [Entamoeba invadens IP1]ELP86156.1 hypothetical protein EIN_328330 [Entamoeba invadens IP1]|eukprot:XP_004185502.1 hypothetical protein EIN_328330 [Entamoeba invadens IP1]